MKPLGRLVVAAAAMAAVLGASLAATAHAAPNCNARAAVQLEKRLPVQPYRAGVLGQTICVDFTGDGRRDIVFSGSVAMTQGAHYWAAFRATRSSWVRVKFKRGCCRADPRFGRAIGIGRSGRQIVVKEAVYRSDDPGCCPTGGTRIGTWGWRSGRLALVDVTLDP